MNTYCDGRPSHNLYCVMLTVSKYVQLLNRYVMTPLKQKLFVAVASCGHVPELAGGVPITGRTPRHVQQLLSWRFKEVPEGMQILEVKEVSNG